MGYCIVHSANSDIPLDVEFINHCQQGIGIVLAEGLGLKNVEEQQVGCFITNCVVNYGVGHVQDSSTLYSPGNRSVSGEIEEVARPGQSTELLGLKVSLELRQRDGANTSYIYPRT